MSKRQRRARDLEDQIAAQHQNELEERPQHKSRQPGTEQGSGGGDTAMLGGDQSQQQEQQQQQDHESAVAAVTAIDAAASAVLASFDPTQQATDEDRFVALSLCLRALRSTDERVACKAAEAIPKFMTAPTVSPEIRAIVLGEGVWRERGGAITPLVALLDGSADTSAVAVRVLHDLAELAVDENKRSSDKEVIPRQIVSKLKGGPALVRAINTALDATGSGDDSSNTTVVCAMYLLSWGLSVTHVVHEGPGCHAAFAATLRALEEGPADCAAHAIRALYLFTGHALDATNHLEALAKESVVAIIARFTARSDGQSDMEADYAAAALLERIYHVPDVSEFDRQCVLDAMVGLLTYDVTCYLSHAVSSLKSIITMGDEHAAAVAKAVAMALHTLPPGDASKVQRMNLHTFLHSSTLRMSSAGIAALLLMAGDAAKLREEVATLKAVPVNTRAAIVELATAARGRES